MNEQTLTVAEIDLIDWNKFRVRLALNDSGAPATGGFCLVPEGENMKLCYPGHLPADEAQPGVLDLKDAPLARPDAAIEALTTAWDPALAAALANGTATDEQVQQAVGNLRHTARWLISNLMRGI